jgi:HSP20 family protein
MTSMTKEEELRPIIHIRIRDLRRERSLTQEELAEALGLSRQSINAMEAGRCLPSLPVALQIASYFAVPLQQLFSLTEELNRQVQQQVEEEAARLNRAINQLTPISNQRKEDAMATLIPWSPLREMRHMLDELMDESAWTPVPQLSGPAVNVKQTNNSVVVEMRLPGFKKEDLSIEVGEDFLTIAGEVKKESQEAGKDEQFFRREFVQQSFSRTVTLPALVQTDKAEAEMKHGVLHITLPKVVEEKPKTAKLQIKAGE